MNISNMREPIHARDSDLKNSEFGNVNLAGSNFDNVNLGGAAFQNVNLSDASFNNVNLSKVQISQANVTGMVINNVPVDELLHAACGHAAGFRAVMPVLRVTDMQRAIDWYTGILGLGQLWRSAADGGGENCMLGEGTVRVLLSTGSHLGGTPAFTGTLYFDTPEVRALFDRIRDKADVVWPLEAMEYGTLEFGIRDPDGYVLAFAAQQRLP